MFNWFWGGWGSDTSTDGYGATSSVPEMDVASGTLAIAVVLAVLVLAWEIKRRRALN